MLIIINVILNTITTKTIFRPCVLDCGIACENSRRKVQTN